ncbi:hypothetical protein BDP27DRAFT_1481775 [Rhodocollybia butyracea]|uniref:DUF6536 domain-containing protein n=1 Tax=Rhodocollybia butyracea TaxID=206335 RepID=A0A9P5PFU6_9AGAR|nr:hypothetical protein BDP27DRAFT_1481775 [Rhodocollybia butyracea]
MPTGWHFGAWMATFQASVVLLINLTVLLFCTVKTKASIGVIFQGDCNTVAHATFGIHLVINVLSTLLLSASNYVMQSLCAPTRTEVDRAHERGFWLDIGLQSMRNLKHTSSWKRFAWISLAVSSVPLHLFPHAVPTSWNSSQCFQTYACSEFGPEPDFLNQPGHWEFLNPSDCMQAYAVDFLSDRRDVVVVWGHQTYNTFVSFESGTSGRVIDQLGGNPYAWLCGDHYGECSTIWREIDPANWTMTLLATVQESSLPSHNYEATQIRGNVQYCLSETTTPKCQLQFNLPLLAIVVAFNIVKVACMAIVATRMRDDPLVTLGDAITSFINNPEPLTKDMCLASQSYFEGLNKNDARSSSLSIKHQTQKTRWMTTAGWRHWIVMGFLFFVALSTVLGLLGFAIHQLNVVYQLSGFSSLWQFGIGKASSDNTIIRWGIPSQGYGAIVASVLLANLPQLIFSMIYLLFNSLCTKFFLALEWSSYAKSRKPLRVSNPHGEQRSSYFLNIPFRFGLPLMIYSISLHWLLSQSIFVVAVTAWNGDHIDTLGGVISCGFSPVGMILTSVVGASLILSSLAVGYFKRLKCDMPLAGSCSAAIAAACHPPEDGADPLKPVKWGVVSKLSDSCSIAIAHISFSSGEVLAPVQGCYYL